MHTTMRQEAGGGGVTEQCESQRGYLPAQGLFHRDPNTRVTISETLRFVQTDDGSGVGAAWAACTELKGVQGRIRGARRPTPISQPSLQFPGCNALVLCGLCVFAWALSRRGGGGGVVLQWRAVLGLAVTARTVFF